MLEQSSIETLADAQSRNAEVIATTTATRVKTIPGPVRSREEVTKLVDEHNAQLMTGLGKRFGDKAPIFADLMGRVSPKDMFRWKIQLDCGCVQDWPTNGEKPDRLFVQTYYCSAYSEHTFERAIVSWSNPREEVDDAKDYEDDPKLYALFRGQKHTKWDVSLECGHTSTKQTKPEFDPEVGPTYRAPEWIENRRREIAAEIAADEVLDRDDPAVKEMNARVQEWLDLGGPSETLVVNCYKCRDNRTVVQYAPLGWLIPRPKSQTEAEKRKATERRLRKVEADAARLAEEAEKLRKELND